MVALIIAALALIISFFTFLVNLQAKAADIVVYIDTDPNVPDMLCLYVSNTGQSTARNIKFTFNKQLPVRAYDEFTDNKRAPNPNIKFLDKGFLIDGLTHLAPLKARKIYLGGYATLCQHFQSENLKCHISYTIKSPIKLWPDSHTTDFFELSIEDWAHDHISDNSHLKKINDTLKNIRSELKNLK